MRCIAKYRDFTWEKFEPLQLCERARGSHKTCKFTIGLILGHVYHDLMSLPKVSDSRELRHSADESCSESS